MVGVPATLMGRIQNSRFFPLETFFYRPGIISSKKPLKYSVSGNVGNTG